MRRRGQDASREADEVLPLIQDYIAREMMRRVDEELLSLWRGFPLMSEKPPRAILRKPMIPIECDPPESETSGRIDCLPASSPVIRHDTEEGASQRAEL